MSVQRKQNPIVAIILAFFLVACMPVVFQGELRVYADTPPEPASNYAELKGFIDSGLYDEILIDGIITIPSDADPIQPSTQITLKRNPSHLQPLFSVPAGSSLLVSNVIIDSNYVSTQFPVVEVSGSFVMESGSTILNGINNFGSGGGVLVAAGGNFLMNEGSEISNCIASAPLGSGGGVFCRGTFVMNGGTIRNCTALNGGGVEIHDNGLFTMDNSASIIKDCYATLMGGGVFVSENAVLALNNGTISGCTAPNSGGGGIYTSGFVSMAGGLITNCNAGAGGGVEIGNDGEFVMSLSSSITDCWSTSLGPTANGGGGVYLDDNAYLTMKDNSSILNCSSETNGSGVYLVDSDDVDFYIYGSPRIGGNGDPTGVYLTSENLSALPHLIKIKEAPLSENAHIGIEGGNPFENGSPIARRDDDTPATFEEASRFVLASSWSAYRIVPDANDISMYVLKAFDASLMTPVKAEVKGQDENSNISLDFDSSSEFAGGDGAAVWVEGNKLALGTDYVFTKTSDGKTILTFKSDYLAKLANGDYNVQLIYANGVTESTLTVNFSGQAGTDGNGNGQSTSPLTGDNTDTMFWSVLLIACLCLVGIFAKKMTTYN